jgi:hypothetical protein
MDGFIIKKFYDFNDVNESISGTFTTGHIVNYFRNNYSKETPIFLYYPSGEGVVKVSNIKDIFEEVELFKYEFLDDKGNTSENNTLYYRYELDPERRGYVFADGRRITPPEPTKVKALIVIS